MIQVLLNVPPDLIIIGGTPAEKELKELAEFAAKEENWWRSTDPDFVVPDPAIFTRHVEVACASGHDHHMVHVIFTFSVGILTTPQGELKGALAVRHATLGLDNFENHPDPTQVLTVAKFLGFTGSYNDWSMEMHPAWTNVVVVTQPVDLPPGKKVIPQMFFNKNGAKREEFWPKQDLANDPKGQEQASSIVKATRLRRSLEKAGFEPDHIKSLMDIWFNKPLKSHEPVPVEKLLTVPLDLNEDEKAAFLELRQRIVGY